MYKLYSLLMLLLILFSGCTDKHKTKEQLVNDGIKLVQDKNPRGAIILFKNALEKDQNYFEARFQLARAYTAVGNFEVAEKELQKVRRQNPSSRDVQIEIARVMVHTNRPDDALKELSSYLSDKAIDCDALEIAGWARAMKDDNSAAVMLLNKAVALCGANTVSPALSLATVYVAMGNAPEAEIQLAKVMEKEPENRKALFLLADIQTRRKDGAAALKTLDRIIQANPGDIEALYRKGLLFIESNDFDNALAISKDIIKQSPDWPEGHRLQGFALFFKKQYSDAIAPLQKALLQQPNAGTYYILGLTHYYRNEFEQAINQFQKALDLQPAFTRARVHLALLLLNKKMADEAIKEAKKVLAQDDENALAHNIVGSAYLLKGNNAEGLAELNRALELDPSLADVHIKKGLVAMKRGKSQEAESELAAAVRLKPEARDTRHLLALYYLNHNEPVKAVEVLKKGIQGGPSDAVSYYLMAEAYLRQNNVKEATAFFVKAKEVDPKYDLAYLKLASIFVMQDKHEQAVQELRSLVEHSPDNVQALLLLASLAEANGDEQEARKTYLRAADTKKTDGIVAAARYLQRTNDTGQALKVLNEGISRSPADIGLYEVKGSILLADRKFKDVLAVDDAIERLNPQAGFAYTVNTYIAMGEPAKALEKVRAEIRKHPENPNLSAELTRIHLRMGNRKEAEENAREIIRKDPDSPIGYLTLALAYQNSNEVDKGIEVLRNANKRNDASLAFMLGDLYSIKKNYVLALEQYRKAEKAKSGSDQVLFRKGTILHAMGKKKEAEVEYQKVLRLSPNHAMALNNLAYLYLEENRSLPQALRYATRAFMIAPQDDSIRDTLGYVLLKNNRIDQGLKMLKKASESSPKNPSILYHLALAYKANGDSSKAKENLQKAIALGEFPEDQDAKALLEKIRKNGTS
ncbi:MAG: PEP-CTERM system TPR-repeat protein PrsT [Nitrospirae bacterium]|nr:PEP-CTERM system TPR-repeat protein PrsT [Nitrospirota bacterium]